MSDEPKDLRIPIMMSAKQVQAIDDWMFAHKIRTRAGAVRRLIELGLAYDHQLKVTAIFLDFIRKFDLLDNVDEDERNHLMSQMRRSIKKFDEILDLGIYERSKYSSKDAE